MTSDRTPDWAALIEPDASSRLDFAIEDRQRSSAEFADAGRQLLDHLARLRAAIQRHVENDE